MTIRCNKCGRTGDIFEFTHYWGEDMDGVFDLLCPDVLCTGDGVIERDSE